MEFRRKIYDQLVQWKQRSCGSTALFVDGARRVGKSHICQFFARNEYRSYLLIDFGNVSTQVKDILENESSDIPSMLAHLAAYYRVQLYKRDSLIIFDEVQLYPRARQLVKYLVAEGSYDYIETGSLITLHSTMDSILIPSEEEHIEMFPLDFEEFCWALNDTVTIPLIQESFDTRTPLGQALHRRIMSDFRLYMLVGGMPQSVLTYVKTQDFSQVHTTKQHIVNLYRSDIPKFAKGYEARVVSIFDNIPSQLNRKEKHYKLATLRKGARWRDFEDAFIWLDESMVVNTCLNATDPGSLLEPSADYTTFKLYMGDTGLLVAMALKGHKFVTSDLYRGILLDKLDVNEGMIAENVVAQMLRPRHTQLYFYSRSDTYHRENRMEIDFLIDGERKPIPIEVKSGRYRPHASLDKFMKRFKGKVEQPIILYSKDVLEEDGILHLPLYMACLL